MLFRSIIRVLVYQHARVIRVRKYNTKAEAWRYQGGRSTRYIRAMDCLLQEASFWPGSSMLQRQLTMHIGGMLIRSSTVTTDGEKRC